MMTWCRRLDLLPPVGRRDTAASEGDASMSGNMNDMLRQAGRMRKDMEKVGEELKERYVEAEAGGNLVEVVFNGQQELVKISLDPKLVEPDTDGKVDLEMLEDLIIAAVSKGIEESKALMKAEMDKATGGLSSSLPGLF